MKVKELVEKLQQFDQELELVRYWDDYNSSFESDLVFIDHVIELLAVDAKYKGFYKRVDDDLSKPEYPDVGAKQYVMIS